MTRLKVDGFKSLVDVDLRLGPFTCIAGGNGAGRSNVFDVITFLSDLADCTFGQAVSRVRTESGDRPGGDDAATVADVLHRDGDDVRDRLRFECEFLIARSGENDLGQPAEAKSTFLRYVLELRARNEDPFSPNPFELVHEELVYVNRGSAKTALPFVSLKGEWFDSVFLNDRKGGAFISTVRDAEGHRVKLHQDGRAEDDGPAKRGRPVTTFDAAKLPRTVLSSVTAAESPTALLARRELRSWRRLQLEASAMRRSDDFGAPRELGSDGAHMPRALHSLVSAGPEGQVDEEDEVLLELAGRVGELVDDVRSIGLDVDMKRQRLTLVGAGRDGVRHAARSLSDGTLRFLALSVLEFGKEPEVICLEEPENGIHPRRIEVMIRLLRDIATDVSRPVGEDNPLRQVIVNTHSPGVVRACPTDAVVVAERIPERQQGSGLHSGATRFRFLPGTWRQRIGEGEQPVFLTELVAYLDYFPSVEIASDDVEIASDDTETSVGQFVESQLHLEID